MIALCDDGAVTQSSRKVSSYWIRSFSSQARAGPSGSALILRAKRIAQLVHLAGGSRFLWAAGMGAQLVNLRVPEPWTKATVGLVAHVAQFWGCFQPYASQWHDRRVVDVRRHAWAGALLLALVAGGLLLFWQSSSLSAPPLLAYLPPEQGAVAFLDFGLLRKTGILDQLAGPAAAEEPDYRAFVSATGFDYREHLDKAVVALYPTGNYFVVEGRFDFSKLSRYATASGGRCLDGVCSMTGSSPDRLISFVALDRKRLVLAVSAQNPAAAASLRSPTTSVIPPGSGAAWLFLPSAALHPKLGLPPAVNLNLAALEGASWARLTVDKPSALSLETAFPSTAAAQQALPRLRGGTFRSSGDRVLGEWPLPKGWLDALASGTTR